MRTEKKQLVKDIKGLLEPSAAGVFLVGYRGLQVKQFSALRQTLADGGAECHVVSNSLLALAAGQLGWSGLAKLKLSAETAIVVGGDDPVMVAKVLKSFAKANPQLQFKAGVLEGKLYEAAQMEQLAELPSRDVLLGQLLGTLQAPAQQLVGILNAKTASVVYALQAYLDKKQGS